MTGPSARGHRTGSRPSSRNDGGDSGATRDGRSESGAAGANGSAARATGPKGGERPTRDPQTAPTPAPSRAADAGALADFHPTELLAVERDRAERALNVVRIIVLALLGVAAMLYAPSLTPALNRVNVLVLFPTLAWAVLQGPLLHRRRRLPTWLGMANAVIDITAVSCIIGGYALASTPMLALKSPITTAYFIIVAALPVASSTRKAAIVSVLAVVEYAALVTGFVTSGTLTLITSPIAAVASSGVSPLDEGARLFLLACAGAVATYATQWQERLSARYAEASRASEQLQARLDQAQLQTLKLQLHPHFLFNTLNAITALIHRAPDRAERMVSGLSELLRISLGSAAEQEVPLEREVEVLEHYVEIQQERFQGRLAVRMDIAPEVSMALVPNLILQPLVENAIKHGIGPRASGGTVEVIGSREVDGLHLVVRDDGVGEAAPQARREGVGLANSRARLASLYGDAFRLSAAPRVAGGFEVSIVLPYHTEPAARLVAATILPD